MMEAEAASHLWWCVAARLLLALWALVVVFLAGQLPGGYQFRADPHNSQRRSKLLAAFGVWALIVGVVWLYTTGAGAAALALVAAAHGALYLSVAKPEEPLEPGQHTSQRTGRAPAAPRDGAANGGRHPAGGPTAGDGDTACSGAPAFGMYGESSKAEDVEHARRQYEGAHRYPQPSAPPVPAGQGEAAMREGDKGGFVHDHPREMPPPSYYQ